MNYLNIITMSMLLMSIYIIYGRWSGKKSWINSMLLVILATIIASKLIFISYGDEIVSVANLSYTYEILIVLFTILLRVKNEKLDKLIFGSYVVAIISISMLKFNAPEVYMQLISMYMLMTTLYLFYMACSYGLNRRYKIISILYFGHVSVSILLKDSIQVLSIVHVLDFVLSIFLFTDIFRLNINYVINANTSILEKLKKFSIKMESKEEKINVNKHITETLNESLIKKQDLMEIILGQCNKCVIVVDSSGFIINEDESFTKMWKEYKNNKYELHLNTFLNDNVKNSNNFLKSINYVNDRGESIEEEFEGKDGRFFSCMYSPCIVGSRNIGTICYIIDITYRKKSEQKIIENDTKYKKIVDNIPYPILLSDKNNIIYDNEKYESINLDKNKIESITLNDKNSGEVNYKCNNGNSICLNIDRASFMDGESTKNLVVIRDITHYKELLNKVELSNAKHESLVNLIPEGIYILDFETKVPTYANDVFLDMANSKSLEAINLDEVSEGMIITSVNSNESISFQRKIIKYRDNQKMHVECGGMIIDVNKKLKLVGVMRDITEQVKTEQMEIEIEKKRLEYKNKNEFFVNMSHELKTPLNLIMSSNQLLEAINKDEINKNPYGELASTVDSVKKNSYMVMGLVNNIMDLSKLEQDFHQYEKDYYNIVDIVEDVCLDFSRHISDSDVEIVFDTDEEEKIVNIDPDDIEKVVLTLLSYVIRYSESGSMITIELKNDEEKDILQVKNDGGYDSSKYTDDYERRSLDVAIEVAKQIIELYNGCINIKSEIGNQIIITVELNIDKGTDEYKEREKSNNGDCIYSEYIRMCNF